MERAFATVNVLVVVLWNVLVCAVDGLAVGEQYFPNAQSTIAGCGTSVDETCGR